MERLKQIRENRQRKSLALAGRVTLAYPLLMAYHTADKTVDKDKPYVFE